MKKILVILFFCFALVLPRLVSADTAANSCLSITRANVDQCCTNANTVAERTACVNYYDNPPAPVAGQINSGVQNTNPQNTSTVSNLAAINTITTNANNPATTCSQIKFNTLLDIAIWAKCIIGAVIIPGIFLLAFAVFLWGVFKFIRSSDIKDKQDSKQFIYMGLIGLFVMVSVWGIIRIATNTFGFDSTVPLLPTSDPLSLSKASTTTTGSN